MSSKYFILSKNENNLVDDNNDNNIVLLNGLTFILPANNIGYYTSNGLLAFNAQQPHLFKLQTSVLECRRRHKSERKMFQFFRDNAQHHVSSMVELSENKQYCGKQRHV